MGLKDLLKQIPNDVTGDGKRFAAALKKFLQMFSTDVDKQVKDIVEELSSVPEQVIRLKLTEEHTTDSNGMPQNDILVEYDNTNVADFVSAQIWVKEADGEYQLFGNSGGVKYTVTGVTTGKTYTVKVVAVNKRGNSSVFEDAPKATITIKGSVLVPDVPRQFVLTWDEEGPLWEWLHEDNGYVDFFELRLDANAGTYSDKLLDRTRDFKSRANPKVRSGTAYLFVRNIFGTYSAPATHQFSKAVGSKPGKPVLNKVLKGVNITMDSLPSGYTGYKLIINGEDFTSDNNEFVYFLFSGNVTVKYCFVDDIGDGEYSDEVTAEVQQLVQSDDIEDGAIKTNLIDVEAITEELIAKNAITTEKIADNAIVDNLIADNAVAAKHIVSNAVTSDKMAANTITSGHIQANAVTAAKIEANAITANKIAANAVTADKIAADAVTADKIQAGAVTATKIHSGSIIGDHISAGAVTTAKIAAGAVQAQQIDSGAVTSDKIKAGAVTAEKMEVESLSSVSATIGTLRTATSGARTEIKDNLIEVYDENNVLRVRMGVWD